MADSCLVDRQQRQQTQRKKQRFSKVRGGVSPQILEGICSTSTIRVALRHRSANQIAPILRVGFGLLYQFYEGLRSLLSEGQTCLVLWVPKTFRNGRFKKGALPVRQEEIFLLLRRHGPPKWTTRLAQTSRHFIPKNPEFSCRFPSRKSQKLPIEWQQQTPVFRSKISRHLRCRTLLSVRYVEYGGRLDILDCRCSPFPQSCCHNKAKTLLAAATARNLFNTPKGGCNVFFC